MTKYFYLTVCLYTMLTIQANAQNGQFDLHFLLNQVDCANMKVSTDITLKASDAASTFNISEQNYRMSFERDVVANPVILEELDLTGFIQMSDSTHVLFSPHSLVGSLDTILSYNMELQSGIGMPILASEWTSVGRLGFDILDPTKCFNLFWHTYAEEHFPHTSIIEVYDNTNKRVNEGTYVDLNVCFYDFCSVAPTAYDDYVAILPNESLTVNVLDNDIDLNNDLDFGTFNLVSTPPVQQMTVTATANPGELVCVPSTGFIGEVAPFEYSICDMDGQCTTAKVYVTVDETVTNINEPESRYDIQLSPTAANDFITVQYLNIPAQGDTQIIITDVNGRILDTRTQPISNNPTYRFEVGNLSQGVYFLSTLIEGEWIAKKFVKI